MSSSGSVTHWLALLQAGDPAAARPLWERYFRRLVALARAKLRDAPRGPADEEDAALSAFHSFCRAAEQGRFPRLGDRDDLVQVLLLLTARKALRQRRRARAQKRGGGRVVPEADLEAGREDEGAALEQVLGHEPTPEFAAQVAEECQHLLDRLGDDELRAVVLAKMEGYTNEEIANRQGCVVRSVERRLRTIRALWAGGNDP
jgi:DNA-directed RNA polymerase specialized sigma24 family protein